MHRPDYIGVYEWNQMTDEERREELRLLAEDELAFKSPVAPKPVAAPKERKPRESSKPAPPITIAPTSIDDAFVLVNGQLMRRRVAIVEVVSKDKTRYTREVEHLSPCGGRVRFGGRVYSAAVVAHYLTTGELVDRVPSPPRYRGRIRINGALVHLGYFATKDERDTVVGLARLGVFPSGSKNACHVLPSGLYLRIG